MNADGNVTDAAMTSETQVAWGSEQPAQKSSDSWGGGGAAWGAGDSAAEPESTSSLVENTTPLTNVQAPSSVNDFHLFFFKFIIQSPVYQVDCISSATSY